MRLLGALACLLGLGLGLGAEAAPQRVVSMNLCTDQLAMLVAAEGQLASVSWLAQDPQASAMAEEAARYPANHGLAEEIFLLEPDLVIAGTYTTRATVEMLRRLGIPVVEFAPASSLEEVRERLMQMGAVLGREARAAALLARFDAGLAALASPAPAGPRPVAGLYDAHSYTSGSGTLAHALVEAAGYTNLAAELGIVGGGRLPLEALVMAAPDLLVTGSGYDAPALAEEGLEHPALGAIRAEAGAAPVADSTWACGTPLVLTAIRRLAEARAAALGR